MGLAPVEQCVNLSQTIWAISANKCNRINIVLTNADGENIKRAANTNLCGHLKESTNLLSIRRHYCPRGACGQGALNPR